MEKNSLSIFLPNLAAMVALGHSIFEIVIPGTSITISGDIGVGKTTLARAIIRAAIGEREEIPSPTFTLVQTYETLSGITIWHFDLYRIDMSEEVLELGIEDAFAYGISLVEWPERLGPFWPPHRLEVIMSFPSGNDGRHVSLHGSGWWNSRIRCLKKIYNKKITLLL